MAQQFGIVVIIDVDAALRAGSLDGCAYFFDNAGPFGTTGQGTDKLVTAIHGTHWLDGSQASEQVLNFVATGITSLPLTLPRDYGHHQARQHEREALARIRTLVSEAGVTNADIRKSLSGIRMPQFSSISRFGHHLKRVLLDNFGRPVPAGAKLDSSTVAQLPPVITGISGEAVDKGIIYPAQYGSPDLVNGGWYWSATVATATPKVWSYTLHIVLYRFVNDPANQDPRWEPVPMTCEGRLNVSNKPMRNGFTGGGTGFLPVGLSY